MNGQRPTVADDDHYYDDPAFADPDEPNPCGSVRFLGYDSVFDCMRPKGHSDYHANTYGVTWDDSEPHVSGSES